MDHKSKKRKKLKKLYEFETYNNDDLSNDESLLDEDDKERIFINNDSIKDDKHQKKISNKPGIKKEKENKSFSYIVRIDKYQRKNMKDKKFLNDRREKIPKNSISTSKYTYYNFLPKILFEQFSKIANIYFLIIAFFQVFKEISNSNGKPVILFPLFIVVSVNGVKDFYEDWKRKKSDDKENSKNTLIYSYKKRNFVKKKWKDVLIGDIIKVKEDEFFPADCIVLTTSEESNCCYIETKSIDGETNLKFKKTNKKLVELLNNSKDTEILINLDTSLIQCQQPNEFIYEFNGKFIGPNNISTPRKVFTNPLTLIHYGIFHTDAFSFLRHLRPN
jgi:phospholipid-transporting ATPase